MAYKILFFFKEVLTLKELGDYLKETRESNGVSLDEAATDLNVSENILKNVESGNTRAFKDMLELRENVKLYAKYLGLDPEKVVDEFNDFLFEHTSKIKLQDILEAEEKSKKEKSTSIVSPYTKVKEKKFNTRIIKFIILIIGIIVFLILLFFILKAILIVENTVDTELLGTYRIKEVI